MKILALDLSTKIGYAVIETGDKLLDFGTHYIDPAYPEELSACTTEYKDIYDAECGAEAVHALVAKHQPDKIVIEQTNGSMFRSSQKTLEFIHYAVLNKLKFLGKHKDTCYIDTSAWKSILQIKLSKDQRKHNQQVKAGGARGKVTNKHLSVAWVNEKYKLNLLIKDNDAADAICMAAASLQKFANVIKPDVDFSAAFN